MMPAISAPVRIDEVFSLDQPFVHLGSGCLRQRRTRQEQLGCEQPGEIVVHSPNRVAHAHRPGGVTVVGTFEGKEAPAVAAAGQLVLDGELERDFDRDRTRVCEEDMVESVRCDCDEPLG